MEKFEVKDGPLAPVIAKLRSWGAGPNPAVNTPNETGRVAGFWLGLWHGVTAPVTFVVSLFSDNVHVFEVHNNGKWYIFGFLLGLTAIWGGSRANSPRARQIPPVSE